jgi:adenylylsulfate kinase
VEKNFFKERWTRSLVKAVTYRVVIIILDFVSVYVLSGKVETALWFMIVSNVYTSVAYFFHERIWNAINWGRGKSTNSKRVSRQ